MWIRARNLLLLFSVRLARLSLRLEAKLFLVGGQTSHFLSLRQYFFFVSFNNLSKNDVMHDILDNIPFRKMRADIFMSGGVWLCFQTVFYMKEKGRKSSSEICL